MALHCIVIDDEPKALSVIEYYISKVPFLNLGQSFRSCLPVPEYIGNHTVDLIFLDINIPDISGIQFLKTLANPPAVIFTTAYSEYAVESYDLDAVDYLLKPIEFERFLKAVNKVLAISVPGNKPGTAGEATASQRNRGIIWIKSGYESIPIRIDDIMYAESAGNYVSYCTRSAKIISLQTMAQVLAPLPPELFVQVHRSYIVAVEHVTKIDARHVYLGAIMLPLSTRYRDQLIKQIEAKGNLQS